MRRSRGATVAEILVAASLFSLAVTLVMGFLVQSARWTRDIRSFQGSEQDLTASLEKIVKGLEQAPRAGVLAFYPSADPTNGDLVLAWATAYDVDGNYVQDPITFEPIYQGYQIVYTDTASEKIYRTYLAATPSTVVTAPGSAAVLAAENPSQDLPLAGGVMLFQLLHPITDAPTEDVLNPCRLRLQVEAAEGREQQLILNRDVRFIY
jgi:type II secretory pathway pseudopilin PulG